MKSNNNAVVPEAREALDKFKMQAASEMGVNLKDGYNGDLTSREAGSIGGQMVKNMLPLRRMYFSRACRVSDGHCVKIRYIASVIV